MNLLHLGLPIVAPAERNSSSQLELPACADTRENIRRVAATGSGAVAQRLQELEDELPVESILEVAAAGISLVTIVLGLTVDSRWFVLPLMISAMLLQQMLQGWCPLLPALRALGFRMEREIYLEHHALEQIEAQQHAEGHFCQQRHPQVPTTNAVEASGPATGAVDGSAFSLRDFLHVGAQ